MVRDSGKFALAVPQVFPLTVSQTTAFFQAMANDIDLDSISKTEAGDAQSEGQISRQGRAPLIPTFDPMRRKMHLPDS